MPSRLPTAAPLYANPCAGTGQTLLIKKSVCPGASSPGCESVGSSSPSVVSRSWRRGTGIFVFEDFHTPKIHQQIAPQAYTDLAHFSYFSCCRIFSVLHHRGFRWCFRDRGHLRAGSCRTRDSEAELQAAEARLYRACLPGESAPFFTISIRRPSMQSCLSGSLHLRPPSRVVVCCVLSLVVW